MDMLGRMVRKGEKLKKGAGEENGGKTFWGEWRGKGREERQKLGRRNEVRKARWGDEFS